MSAVGICGGEKGESGAKLRTGWMGGVGNSDIIGESDSMFDKKRRQKHPHVAKISDALVNMIAKKDPALWEKAKQTVCKRSPRLCPHSARKMQAAVKVYKQLGGTFKGKRSKANSLRKWTDQKWRTHTGELSLGRLRYLPSDKWKRLSPRQVARTNMAKASGTKKGHQWVPQPDDVKQALQKKPYQKSRIRGSVRSSFQ
jgi:hypothetical protein